MLLIQEIYYTLVSENDKNVFEATLEVLEDYFVPTFLSSDICFNKLCRQVVKLRTNLSVDCICTQLLANLAPTKMIKFVINSLTNVSQAVCTENSYKNKGGIVS